MIAGEKKHLNRCRELVVVSISCRFDTFIFRIDVFVTWKASFPAANLPLLSVYLQEAELVSFIPRCESPTRAADADSRGIKTVWGLSKHVSRHPDRVFLADVFPQRLKTERWGLSLGSAPWAAEQNADLNPHVTAGFLRYCVSGSGLAPAVQIIYY